MGYKPYAVCVGRKYRAIPKLYRPFVILISSNFCNQYFAEINKVRFISQFLRWFYKSRWGYKISHNIKAKNGILDGDTIVLCGRTQKAAFKKLLAKLNYELSDYDILKRRQYILNFTFLFLGVKSMIKENIFVDILSSHEDMFKIFFVVDGYHVEAFNNILYYYDTFVYNQSYVIEKIIEINSDNFNVFDKSISLSDIENIEYSLGLDAIKKVNI
jgi:hypothetical protein